MARELVLGGSLVAAGDPPHPRYDGDPPHPRYDDPPHPGHPGDGDDDDGGDRPPAAALSFDIRAGEDGESTVVLDAG